jgi:glycosyltransferase involved in cell wall biosynthesis
MSKVSVVIPTYKAEKYIAATIQSVLSQTYTDFEILIIDDGSPDNSLNICRLFQDRRIRIISQPNRGLPGARNTGIREASGDFIAFLDADDVWHPQKLEKHVEHLNASPAVGVSFSYSAFIDEKGRLNGLYQKPKKLHSITPSYILCRNPVGNGSAAVIRRQVFDAIKFYDNLHGVDEDCYFDERLRQKSADATDVECWLRIAITTQWQFSGLPEPLTLYRVNSGGLSANALSQLDALDKVIEKTRSYAPDVIGECEQKARAYHLRYTARRMVTMRNGAMAVNMLHKAIASDWRIFLEEPRRSLITAIAAYLLWLLPQGLYSKAEGLALSAIQSVRKSRQVQTQSGLRTLATRY